MSFVPPDGLPRYQSTSSIEEPSVNTNATTTVTPTTPSRLGAKVGVVISVLVGAFLVFDLAGKLAGIQQVKEGTEALGFPAGQAFVMGVVLTVCVVVYAIPRTAVLGALGITAYLGGAVTANMRVEAPLFSATLFAVYFGVLMWVGMVLRRPELLRVAGLTR
jgi:DoxX-like protein